MSVQIFDRLARSGERSVLESLVRGLAPQACPAGCKGVVVVELQCTDETACSANTRRAWTGFAQLTNSDAGREGFIPAHRGIATGGKRQGLRGSALVCVLLCVTWSASRIMCHRVPALLSVLLLSSVHIHTCSGTQREPSGAFLLAGTCWEHRVATTISVHGRVVRHVKGVHE